MGKNKNEKPTVEAPVVEKPETEVKTPTVQTVNTGMPSGLSQDAKVQYAAVLQHRKDEMLKNGGENATKYVVYTLMEDATILDIAVSEAVIRKNPMGLIFCSNEKNWLMLQELGKEMGVTIPEFKNLPKPTKEQLKLAGLEAVPGQVVLKLEEKDISKETKEQKKKEHQIVDESKNKDYVKDHTKIQTDEQLKEALGFQLVNPQITNPIERLVTTAIFYRSYLEANSDKAEDPNAELERIHALTKADLLSEIITMVPPTFIAKGFGDLLGRRAHDANSIVPAFCMLKSCVTDRKTGVQKYSDEEIAAFVRILIAWYVSNKSAEMSKTIEDKEANIKALKKDAKANAKGIETEEKKIAGLKKSIEHFNGMLPLITDPSFDIADNFIAAYNNKEDGMHLSATQIAAAILDTYYRGVDIPELEFDSALLNIQQHTGIILNLFSSPLAKRDEYDESNLIVFGESKPEKSSEEESKN